MSTRTFCDLCSDPVEGPLPTHEIARNGIARFVLIVQLRHIIHGGTDNGEPMDVCHVCLAKALREMADNLEAKR